MASNKARRVLLDAEAKARRTRALARYAALGGLCYAAGIATSAILEPEYQRSDNDGSVATEPAGALDLTGGRPTSKRRTRVIERPFLVRPLESCSVGDPEQEDKYRTQQASEMLGLLRAQVASAERIHGHAGPEAVVNGLGQYVLGWADGVVRTAPDLAEELAAEIETSMCDPRTSPAQTMILTRVMQKMPELGNPRGFDCVLQRGSEDVVLWEALDAWRLSALPKTDAMEQLERTSTDERTLRRLVKQVDEVVQRPEMLPEGERGDGPIETAPAQVGDVALALTQAGEPGDLQVQAGETAVDRMRTAPAGAQPGPASERGESAAVEVE